MNETPSPYLAPQSGMTPPPPEAMAPVKTAIPKVFGIIHIVYASLGIVGAIFSVGFFLFMKMVMSDAGAEMQEMEVFLDAYNDMAIYSYIDAAVKIVLGIVLLVSGIGLLKRKLWAQKASIFWSVVRIIAVIVITVVTYGPSRQLQDKMSEMSQNQPGQFDQGAFQSSIQGASSVLSIVILAIYPVVCLIFLSKKSVKDALH